MNATVKQEYDSLMELARGRCRDEQELDMVRKAFNFANEAHRDVLLHSGDPYILQVLEEAKIVVDKVGLGYKSICAALLAGVIENTEYSADDIRSLFGDKITSLVEGLSNIDKILDSYESEEAERFKRILLTMGDDVRVVLIKLAGRLQCMRTLYSFPESKRERILAETMAIFVPLAHRLGLYGIKTEMENIWIRYAHPREFAEIEQRLSKDAERRTRELDEFIAPISEHLLEKGYRFEIKKRIKSPYSIWYKMKTKQVNFEQIFDLYAVRVIFESDTDDREKERGQAYDIYNTVTSLYSDMRGRMRDWIRQPKNNGYEALHCTVMSKAGMWVEVQIRSRRMDDIAEKGIAAHWSYKNDGYLSEADSQVDRWLAKVQEILSSKDTGSLELLDIIQDDIVTNEIVVFTPRGQQRSVPKGSTALDFAYKLHTDLGNQAIAAKVNMKLVPLSKVLKAGDQVEIITARNATPKAEWMNFLHTRYAKRRLMEWLKANSPQDYDYLNAPASPDIPLKIRIKGNNRPGLASEITEALKQIDGIDDVIINDL